MIKKSKDSWKIWEWNYKEKVCRYK